MAFLGALPARFRRERVLIVGCGDVGLRSARALGSGARVRLFALTSTPARVAGLRAAGITPLAGNLDDPASLRRLAGLATRVLHLAPPPGTGLGDPRSLALARVLARRSRPQALVYGSTSGVYGDCGGAWVDEVRAVNPATPRARRRVAAEDLLRSWGLALGVPVGVLRIPGIYAPDREGGTPRERLLRGRQGSPTKHAIGGGRRPPANFQGCRLGGLLEPENGSQILGSTGAEVSGDSIDGRVVTVALDNVDDRRAAKDEQRGEVLRLGRGR